LSRFWVIAIVAVIVADAAVVLVTDLPDQWMRAILVGIMYPALLLYEWLPLREQGPEVRDAVDRLIFPAVLGLTLLAWH
jgi:uncharacterized membrane protein YfcA